MKNLAIVTELYDPSIGGQEIRYKEWSKTFIQNNWAVTILTVDHLGNLPKHEKVNGVDVIRLVHNKNYINTSCILRNPFTVIHFTYKVRSFFKKNAHKYDCVIFNQWPVLPQLLIGRRVQNAVHDWCELSSGLIWKTIQKLLSKSVGKHICVSPGIEDRLISEYGISKDSIQTIESGIDFKKYEIDESKRDVILFFGRLAPHKHPEHAIEAVIALNDQHGRNVKILIVGGGQMHEYLQEKYGDIGCVQILGRIPDEKKMSVLQQALIHILPSEREGFPRVVAECMAVGVPTITTNYPDNGTVQVVERYNAGIVVEPEVHNIVDGLESLLNDTDRLKSMSAECIDQAKLLDWEILYQKFVKFMNID